jgi:hypothetical protein
LRLGRKKLILQSGIIESGDDDESFTGRSGASLNLSDRRSGTVVRNGLRPIVLQSLQQGQGLRG